MVERLFREEATAASRSATWLGPTLLSQPLSFWVLTGFASAAAISVVLFLCLADYTRRQTVEGTIVPVLGLAQVSAPVNGVLERVQIKEGQRVEQGQVLAQVTVPRATLAAGDTAVALDKRLIARADGLQQARDAQSKQLTAQATGMRAQLEAVRRQSAQIDAEIRLREQQVKIANDTLGRLRSLQTERFVGDIQVKQQESQVLDQSLQLSQLQRQAGELRRRIAEYEQSLAELPARLAESEAQFKRDRAGLEQERIETRSRSVVVLVAPVAGLLAAQSLKSGQAVAEGQNIASIVPGDGMMEAELMIPSRAIGFVAPGDRVLLRYRAFPYQKFGHHEGRIVRVSRSAVGAEAFAGASATAKPATDSGESFYRATVSLRRQSVSAYGREEPLVAGMQLDADIIGERRSLIEWLFEPLYSITRRAATERP